MNTASGLWRIDIDVTGEFGGLGDDPTGQLEALTLFLSERAPQGWEELPRPDGGLTLRVHLDREELAKDLADRIARDFPGLFLELSRIERTDWGAAWMEFFTPIAIGERFTVIPPWLEDADHGGREPIVIEPKMAFGTGHHPTTALCLKVLAGELAGRPLPGGAFLDLGTGTGILGIALAKLGMTGIGLDIDPQAVDCARANADINHVADRFTLAPGSLDILPPASVFSVIVANILAGPLRDMAGAIRERLEPGGLLILSGILAGQAEAVAQAYVSLGLPDPRVVIDGEWAALVTRA